MADKNEQPLEFKFIIEVKIKFVPTQQMLDIVNRVLWNPETTQPDKDSVKPAIDPAAELQSLWNLKLKPTDSSNIAATPHIKEPDKDSVKPAIDPAAEPQPLREIEKIDKLDYIQDLVDVPGFMNLQYAETRDKRLRIMYGSTPVNTTWADIHTICACTKKQRKDAITRVVGKINTSNKFTAVSRFAKAVSAGVISPYKADILTDEDPDAAFKPVLSGVINTRVGEEDGKVEGTLEQ